MNSGHPTRLKHLFSSGFFILLAAALLTVCGCHPKPEPPPKPIADFTFIHASDVHTPMPQSRETISRMRGLGDINFEPFGVTIQKPSFAIVTGDLTEFGGGRGWWAEYQSYWKDVGFPVYSSLGNHDNTWRANIKSFRDGGHAPYYSFDENGCHFIAFMTPTAQDPRPSVGEEELLWLQKDLEKVPPTTPVFIFFHHPLGGVEFASRYDWERLMDVLRRKNTALMLAGHSHAHVYKAVEGMDQMTGGSTFGPNAGFAIVSIKDGILRAGYWSNGKTNPELKLLQKTLPLKSDYPVIEITAPGFRGSSPRTLNIAAQLDGQTTISNATYSVDDDVTGDLKLSGAGSQWKASGQAELEKLLPGAHNLRVSFSSGGKHYTRSTEFFLEPAGSPTAWRAYLAASSKVPPAIANGVVYVGANDGRLHAYDSKSGKELWTAATSAEILAEPLVAEDKVIVGNGLGVVAAYSLKGQPLWSFTADDAVYSSPVLAEGKVIFGCNDGKLYALDAATGKKAWVNDDAGYAVESKPFVANGKVYYGAWDEYVRCVDAKSGKLIWKQQGEGSRTAKAAKRYYSPADAMPVVAEGKLLVADRNFYLTILNAETGERISSQKEVSATGLSEDGHHVYLRKVNGGLAKIDSDGKEIWSLPSDAVHLGAIPTAPVEKNGVVYVCSSKGTVSAVSADKGEVLWKYSASPELFVMSSVACDGANAYVTAFDGTLTAIKIPTTRTQQAAK